MVDPLAVPARRRAARLGLLSSLPTLALALCSQAIWVDRPGGHLAAAPDAQEPTNPAAQTGQAQAPRPIRYARVREQPVELRNLPDAKDHALLQLPAGTLVAVYGEQAGWLKADVPGGFPVWVFGRFLEPTEDPGVVRVTRSRVYMRPLPSGDNNSYPLDQRLKQDDRLAVLARHDSSLPMSEDWVQVWSPEGVWGYLPAEGVVPLGREEDGEALWLRAERNLLMRSQIGRSEANAKPDATRATSASAPRVRPVALEALDQARALLESERAKKLPDFDSVRSALEKARALDPDVLTTAEIDKEFEMVAAFEKLHRTEALLEETRLQRQQELLRVRQKQWEELVERDPLYSRFTLRGRLERFQEVDGRRIYRLRRGSSAGADLTCPSGRYDLELFIGCEIGLVGERSEPSAEAADQEGLELAPLGFAVQRLEVLSTPR